MAVIFFAKVYHSPISSKLFPIFIRLDLKIADNKNYNGTTTIVIRKNRILFCRAIAN